jgi:hypothetical protein
VSFEFTKAHQQARHDAAKAMLAALKGARWIVEVAVDDDRFADELKAIDDAIAQAEAAGIKP